VYVIDPLRQRLLYSWRGHSGLINFILPWRDQVWTAADDGIRVWSKRPRSATEPPVLEKDLKAHSGRVLALAKAGTHQPHIWSSSWDKSILVWDARSLTCLQELRLHEDAVRVLLPLDGHTLLSGSLDNSVAAWRYR